jgi:hypothetical protein
LELDIFCWAVIAGEVFIFINDQLMIAEGAEVIKLSINH